MEILIIGVGALLVYLLAKSKDKTDAGDAPEFESEPGPDIPDVPPDGAGELGPGPDVPEPDGGTLGKIADKAKDIFAKLPVPDPDDPIELAPGPGPDPDTPGSTPADPIGSKDLYEGFVGYFVVQSGDNMTKMANRLGLGTGGWKVLRDDPENAWAVDKCPTSTKDKYYGGQDGIDLRANYGKSPGMDCVAPGYKAKLYFKIPLTGQYPVLHWGG